MRAAVAAGLAGAAVCCALAAQPALPAPGAPRAAPETIGRSVGGRPIRATQLGDPAGTRAALVVGVIHGDEHAGLRVIKAIKREAPALVGTKLWLISTVNPDRTGRHSRRNAHGVDLNRNFPFRWRGGVPRSSGYYPGPKPASEPETRAVMHFVERIHPQVSIWYHQPWGAVLACPGPDAAVRYANMVGMRTSCRGHRLRGTAISWEQHAIPGSVAFVVEFPAGALSSAAANRHARAAISIAGGGA